MANALQAHTMAGPYGDQIECAKFTITDISQYFTFAGILTAGQEYALSFWVRSDAAGSIDFADADTATGASWAKHEVIFTGQKSDLQLFFRSIGTYYFSFSKLERGNRATDWTAAPEDTEKDIADLATRVTTAEAEIKVQAGQIALTATKTELEKSASDTAQTITEVQAQITNSADAIRNEVALNYVNQDAYSRDVTSLRTEIRQTSEDITATLEKSITEQVNGVDTKIENVTKVIHITATDGVTIQQEGSPYATNIDNDEYNMTYNGIKVFYVINETLFTPNVRITKSMYLLGFEVVKNGNTIDWNYIG